MAALQDIATVLAPSTSSASGAMRLQEMTLIATNERVALGHVVARGATVAYISLATAATIVDPIPRGFAGLAAGACFAAAG